METVSGFFIKDLRIITNRTLKDIVMVDNLVHSFGLQLTNGIPILDFTNNK
jgi:CTD small phosphatase-like protein 2